MLKQSKMLSLQGQADINWLLLTNDREGHLSVDYASALCKEEIIVITIKISPISRKVQHMFHLQTA